MNNNKPTKSEKIWTAIIFVIFPVYLVLLILLIFDIWSIPYGLDLFLSAGMWLSLGFLSKDRNPNMAKFYFIVSAIKLILGIISIFP